MFFSQVGFRTFIIYLPYQFYHNLFKIYQPKFHNRLVEFVFLWAFESFQVSKIVPVFLMQVNLANHLIFKRRSQDFMF